MGRRKSTKALPIIANGWTGPPTVQKRETLVICDTLKLNGDGPFLWVEKQASQKLRAAVIGDETSGFTSRTVGLRDQKAGHLDRVICLPCGGPGYAASCIRPALRSLDGGATQLVP